VLEVLESNGKLDQNMVERTRKFIQENRFDVDASVNSAEKVVKDPVKKFTVCENFLLHFKL
jgi:hypothetical protein